MGEPAATSARPGLRERPPVGQKPGTDHQGLPPPKAVPSRLPVPGLRHKRPASSENESPKERPSKRARGPTVSAKRASTVFTAFRPKPPSAASGGQSQHPTGRRRLSSRAGREVETTSGTAPTQQQASATAAQLRTRKRPAWDLKGQVSDLRAKESIYREKIEGLTGEKQALERQLAEQGQELKQAAAQNKELASRTSLLATEVQVCQEQAQERLQRLTLLLAKEKQLEETLQNQTRLNGKLKEAQAEMEGVNRDLVARLEAREAELRSAQESLAWHRQDGEKLRARLAEQEQQLHQSEMERRILHNTVQELKGNIRVFCRVRPLLACEKDAQKGMGHLLFPPGNKNSLVICKAEESHVGRERKDDITYEFNFDRVFQPSSSQEEVFEEIALLVKSALDGYHVCIFAYGQTGSGKTYTMEGPEDKGPDTVGLIPRAVQQVFRASREMEAKGWKYCFTANFLEIYNENLRDLLVPRPERSSELEIRRVSQCTEELHVPGLNCVPVASEEEVLKLLRRAQAHRSVAKTTLNERSSRSHSLFQLHIEGHSASRDLHTSSVLSLVDLAGSERLDRSLSTGERLKETQAINSSLSNLGLVIMALSNKEAHVPYRNSKLTYLLQNSLGGNSKMLMFVNISPLEENLGESLNSLRFAKKVNECVIGTAQANRK